MSDYYGGEPLTPDQEREARLDTTLVLIEVRAERIRQRARYGLNRDLEDGTGPDANIVWSPLVFGDGAQPPAAREAEQAFRRDYELHEQITGRPTWMHLVREEVAEAFAESDPVRLRAELLQVAALAVSWIETLDRRAADGQG